MMVLKADQERVKTLLKDTITLLCRNGLTFKSQFSIEALIGVTLDDDDVFLVSIKELIKSEKAHHHVKHSSDHHHHDGENQKRSNKASSKEKSRLAERERDKERERERERQERERERAEREREKILQERERERERLEREKANRESREREPQKRKHHEIKEEEESEDDEEDYDEEPEEGEINLPYMQGKPPDMWHEDEDDHPSYDESSSQSFPPITEPLLPKRESGQLSPIKQARVVAQPRVPNTESSGGDIVFIKEEPDETGSWGPPDDDDDLDDGELQAELYHNMVVPVNEGGMAGMMPGMDGTWQGRGYRHPRSATITSGEHHDAEHGDAQDMEDGMFYAVCDYDEDYDELGEMEDDMDDMDPEMAHRMGHMSHDLGNMSHDLGEELPPHILVQELSQDGSQQDVDHKPPSKKSRTAGTTSANQTTMYFCQVCARSFESLRHYNTHKDEHKGIFKHTCGECGKGYNTKGKLETHVRHHTGERFLCTLCGKGLMSKTSLKRHLKSMHEDKPAP